MLDILNQLFPEEVSFNIMKYMSHPLAQEYKNIITNYIVYDDDGLIDSFNINEFFMRHIKQNCYRCYKLKSKPKGVNTIYCTDCDRIRWNEYLQTCKKHGSGDGCD